MSRVAELKTELDSARAEVLAVLADGPLKTGDFIARLGHSCGDFYFTKMIGDGRGEWDDSPHQLAQSDLIDEGEVQWRKDDRLDVWYALKGTWPVEECGDDSPIIARIEKFLDAVANAIADPEYDEEGEEIDPCPKDVGRRGWDSISFNVREITDEKHDDCRSIYCDGEKVIVVDYDFVVGAEGEDESCTEFPWPEVERSPERVAAAVLKALNE